MRQLEIIEFSNVKRMVDEFGDYINIDIKSILPNLDRHDILDTPRTKNVPVSYRFSDGQWDYLVSQLEEKQRQMGVRSTSELKEYDDYGLLLAPNVTISCNTIPAITSIVDFGNLLEDKFVIYSNLNTNNQHIELSIIRSSIRIKGSED